MQETELDKIVDQSPEQETTCVFDVRACTEGIETGQQIVANHLYAEAERKSKCNFDTHLWAEMLKESKAEIVDTILQRRSECADANEPNSGTIFLRQMPCKRFQAVKSLSLAPAESRSAVLCGRGKMSIKRSTS